MSCSSHDVVRLELLGVPAVYVAAETFTQAATTQAELLPLAPYRVFVPAPVASRRPDEIRTFAGDALGSLVTTLEHGGEIAVPASEPQHPEASPPGSSS